jgi:hypothetical protein
MSDTVQNKETPPHITNMMTAREAILADLKDRAQRGDTSVKALSDRDAHRWHKPQANYYAGGGEIVCPVCKTGKLCYSRAAYNGHVHAACSTNGCVAWME